MKTKYAAGLAVIFLITSLLQPPGAQSAGPVVTHASTTAQIIAAIRAANESGVQTIIEVAPKHYQFTTIVHTAYGRSALPLIKGNIIIHGGGPQTTIFDNGLPAGNALSGFGRFISIAPNAHLAVSGLAFTRASLQCGECPIESPIVGGGALGNFGGTVIVDNCDIFENQAVNFDGALGGALYSEGGALTIKNSTLSNNGVTGPGGAMFARSGTVLIQNSQFRGNRATPNGDGNGGVASGGAIVLSSGKLTILRSTFSGNVAGAVDDDGVGQGGAIFNAGTLVVRNSAIIENTTLFIGKGGGLYNAGTATLENSTVGGNTSGTLGGGIFNENLLKLKGVTVAGNQSLNAQRSDSEECLDGLCPEGGGGIWNAAQGIFTSAVGRVELDSTVIANNTAARIGPDCAGILTSKGYNAVSNTVDCDLRRLPTLPPAKADKLNVPVRLGELRENGVAGKAHFPVRECSPLIDAAGPFPGGCSTGDQLFRARRDGNGDGVVRCDIGAIEF